MPKKSKKDESTKAGGKAGNIGTIERSGRAMKITSEEFGSEKFDVNSFVTQIFEQKTPGEVKAIHAHLEAKKDENAKRLQASAIENYPLFLQSVKEVSDLETDLEQVREQFHIMATSLDSIQESMVDISLLSSGFRRLIMSQKAQRGNGPNTYDDDAEDDGSRDEDIIRSSTGRRNSCVRKDDGGYDDDDGECGDGADLGNIEKDIEWLTRVKEGIALNVSQRKFTEALALMIKVADIIGSNKVLDFALEETDLERDLDVAVRTLGHALADDVLLRRSRESMHNMARLGMRSRAKGCFLAATSKVIRRELACTRFEGDVLRYASLLSSTFYTALADAYAQYSEVFDSPDDSSRFTQWAGRETEKYCDVFKRRVFFSEDFFTVAEAIDLSLFHCLNTLPEGLDISFIVKNSLSNGVAEMIESTEKRLELQIPKWVEQDTWAPVRCFVRTGGYNGISQGAATIVPPLAPGRRDPMGPSEGGGEGGVHGVAKTEVCATRSVIMVGKAMFDYTDNLMPLAEPSLTRAIGQSLQSFVGKVFGEYEAAVATATEEHGLAIVLDAIVLAEYIVPKVVARMDHALGCTVGETRLLLGFAQAQNEALLRRFGKAAALRYVNNTIGWSGTDYSELTKDAEGGVTAPRKAIDDFVDQAQALVATLAAAAPRSPYISVVTKTIIDECAAELGNERNGFWANVAAQGITKLGLQQLTLDLKYFAHLCEKLMSRQTGDLIKAMIKRARKHKKKGGSSSSGQDPDPSEEWYERTVRANTSRDKIFSNFISNLN